MIHAKSYKKNIRFRYLLFSIILLPHVNFYAQGSDSLNGRVDYDNMKVKIFLDCDDCDSNYLQEEIQFVDFVRDPQLAQVHILITHQNTGSTGRHYEISFIGKRNYKGDDETLYFESYAADSDDIVREGIARKVMLGLIPYISKTEAADRLRIKYKNADEDLITRYESDPWDNWIFNIDLTGGIEAEENQKDYSVTSGLKAKRVTEDWKIIGNIAYQFEEEIFDDDDGRVLSDKRKWETNLSLVKSLTEHLSLGIFGELHSTTYKNLKLRKDLDLALEYNIFPWKEANQWLLTLAYHNGLKSYNYFEETIYSKQHETLWFHSVVFKLDMIKPWGSIDSRVELYHLIQLHHKYNLNIDLGLSLRVTQGLALRISFNAESIHDQIYLPKGDASLEEILLKQRQLVTSYDLNFEMGVSFTFGSIYNSVVNRRL